MTLLFRVLLLWGLMRSVLIFHLTVFPLEDLHVCVYVCAGAYACMETGGGLVHFCLDTGSVTSLQLTK